jgi:hypothetical protein
VLALCDRWQCLPSQLLAEPAEVLQLLEFERIAKGASDDACGR